MSLLKKKILIVDDMEINREVLIALLEDEYEILEAADGQEALKILMEDIITTQDNPIELIITDIDMPNVDGFELLRNLQKSGYYSPAIIITPNDSNEYQIKAYQLGAIDYISKPFDPDLTKCKIRAILKNKGN